MGKLVIAVYRLRPIQSYFIDFDSGIPNWCSILLCEESILLQCLSSLLLHVHTAGCSVNFGEANVDNFLSVNSVKITSFSHCF